MHSRSQESQPVAAGSCTADEWSFDPKPARNRDSRPVQPAPVAKVATVAAPARQFPWSAGLATLEEMARPARMSAEAWDELVNEAAMVSRVWGEKALSCGWQPLDLFGCNPNPFARRLDRDGLVAAVTSLLTPVRIMEITADAAVLSDRHGSILKFRPDRSPAQVFLWEAYHMFSGP